MDEQDLPGDSTHHVEVDGAPVLLSRSSDGELCAISDVCSHEGGTLSEGRREGDTVVCPLHGSRFDLRTGKALGGPAVFPQRAYETRAREGKVEIKAVE
jgi:nitrite reductase/ring-hydroxylating ferredoxin subunit